MGGAELSMTLRLPSLPSSFTCSAARAGGLSDRRLRKLVAEDVLTRIGRGVYRRTTAPVVDVDLVEIGLRAPEATLCLISALARHELTDQIPTAIEVALPRARRPPRLDAPVRWHRFHEATFALGREVIDVGDGVALGVYSPERSIVDAFRLRHLEGEEVAVEALRRWLRRPGAHPAMPAVARALLPKRGTCASRSAEGPLVKGPAVDRANQQVEVNDDHLRSCSLRTVSSSSSAAATANALSRFTPRACPIACVVGT
jgi:hypothetical protein